MEVPSWCLGVERHGGLVESPFAEDWEGNAVWFDCENFNDGHRWELVYLQHVGRTIAEFVVRCLVCYVPRCGDSNDLDPCVLRRHHVSRHSPLSGKVPDLANPEAVRAWLT